MQANFNKDFSSTRQALEVTLASPELHCLWGSVPASSRDFVNVLCLLQGFFVFLETGYMT